MGMVVSFGFKVIQKALKFLWFIGIYWLIICMSPVWIYEWIAPAWAKSHGGTFFGIHPLGIRPNGYGNFIAPVWLQNITFYLTLVFMALTFVQNLYRVFKKDRSFNIFRSLFHIARNVNSRSAMGHDFARAARRVKGEDALVVTVPANEISNGFLFGKESNGVDEKGNPKKAPSNPQYVMQPQETDGHILIIGSPGSGKTSSIAIPTLMSWKSRVFAIDIKGELYEKTSHVRENIKVFNPTDPTAFSYDPYYMLRNTDDIAAEAKALALAICPLSANVNQPYWIQSAQAMLTGFIIYYFNQGVNFSETMLRIKSIPVRELIASIMVDNDNQAKAQVSQFDGLDDKTLSGIFTELSIHITGFATNDDLQRALSGAGDCITPQDLEEGCDIYLCIPQYKLSQWSDLLAMICSQFLEAFERRLPQCKEPILFLIDEFPRLGKVEPINHGLATLRGNKIHIALIIQSISQLNDIYGKNAAEAIEDDCTYKAVLFAAGSETQEWCSKLVGTYEKSKRTSSYNADVIGIGKGQGTSTTTEEKRVIKPEDFGKLISQKQLVFFFPGGAARLDKIFYWREEAFKSLTEKTAGANQESRDDTQETANI